MIKYFGIYLGAYEEDWIAYGETKKEILDKLISLSGDNKNLTIKDITFYKVKSIK